VPSLDWQTPCIYCTYVYTAVTCKTVNNTYPQGAGLFTNDVCRMPTSKIVNIDYMYCWLWPRQIIDTSSRQREPPYRQNGNCVTVQKSGLVPQMGPRLTDRLTVGRIVALTRMNQCELGGRELSSWIRCERVAGQREPELLSNGSRGRCWVPLPGSA
jgi:hypothetical protein